MSDSREVDAQAVAGLLRSEGDRVGAFEAVIGLNTATTSIKAVHLMNDLAQQVLGGAPAHRGDLLCRVIRFDHVGEGDDEEDNSDAALRADEAHGPAYRRAFPANLGPRRTRSLREGAQLLLNSDGGMYRAGDNMASGLATHRALLGYEGFTRFGLGGALAQMMGEAGRRRVAELFEDDFDPVTRALRPLLVEADLVQRRSGRGDLRLTSFDERFGARLTNLLEHPLSKPLALRSVALAGVMWMCLRVLGVGRADGRPALLAIPSRWRDLGVRLRQEAVQSYASGIAAMDAAIAAQLENDPEFLALLETDPPDDATTITVSRGEPGMSAIAGLRDVAAPRITGAVYWPDAFAAALGRKAGFVGPPTDRAGWGKYVCLTPDLLEVLILMFSDPGGAARGWRELWAEVRDELGVAVGAEPDKDDRLLRDAGVRQVSLEQLELSAERLLDQAAARGLARRLPDSEAEAGAALM